MRYETVRKRIPVEKQPKGINRQLIEEDYKWHTEYENSKTT